MTHQSFSSRSRRPDRASRLRRRVQAVVLTVALVATSVVTAQVAEAQKVGNPGTINFAIADGYVKVGSQNVSLTPNPLTQCADGINNDGDPTDPAAAQDVLIDFPADPQCTSATDDSEVASGFQPKQPTVFTGTVAANGAVNIPQSGIVFSPIYVFAAGGEITLRIQPQAPGTGNINPLTGVGSLTISLRLKIEGAAAGVSLGDSCIVPTFTLNLRTGATTPPSGFEPLVGVPYNPDTGQATLVDNNFPVPGSSGCGPLGAASGPLNAQFGVPSPAGLNEASLVVVATPKITKGVNASAVATPSTGVAPLTVSFNGTGSSAVPGKSITSYEWDFTNDGTVDATGSTTTNTYNTPGVYTAKLTVTDSDGDKDSKTVTVTVNEPPNVPPVANIASSGSGGQAPYTVTFNGSGSNDPDGSIASYAWDFGNGRTATGATPAAVTYQQPGAYNVSLTVTDNRGATSTATRLITVTGAPNVPPTASIRTVSVAGTVPKTVNLSGSNSSDPDGTIESYEWDLGNGETATGVGVEAVYTEPGEYTVTLTVTDDRGATATATTVVEVSEDANVAPTADVSATPISGTAPLSVTFDGSGSSDFDGSVVSYAWDFGNGEFASGPTPPSTTYPLPGTYTAKLTVTDNRGATNTATRQITVNRKPNVPPTAAVSATPGTGSAPQLVQFSSAGTTDTDGSVVSYLWNFGNGQTSTSPSPTTTYATAGSYSVSLTVTDNDGATDVKSTSVTVLPPNVPPVAAIQASTVTGSAPLPVSFNGAGSTDSDGFVATYSWNFGNGQTATGPVASTTYNSVGTFTARLTVTDNRGLSRSATVTVVVTSVNLPPVARMTALPTAGQAPLRVAFDGTTSSDPDGSIANYAWDFGNGATATGGRVQYTFTLVGSYTVTLRVTDNRGATNSTAMLVVVDPPAPARDRVRLQFTGGLSYTFDGATNGVGLRLQRDFFGIASVNGFAPYTGPGGSSATVSVNLSRFLIFPVYGGTVTVNDPANGVNNVTTTLTFASLASPSSTSVRGTGAGSLTNPTRNYNLAFTIDDRAA